MEGLAPSSFWTTAGLCLGAACTLAMFSFLWRENAVYRFFEHIFVGLGMGYTVAITWNDVLKPNWWDKGPWVENGHPWPLWCLFLTVGMMWFFQLSEKRYWLSRIPMGILMGSGAGLIFRKIHGFFFTADGQVTKSFLPLVARGSEGALQMQWDNLLIVTTIVCVLCYFIFWERGRNKLTEGPARLGRWLLMISFGATFGATVMARLSLLIDRAQYLIEQCLGLGG